MKQVKRLIKKKLTASKNNNPGLKTDDFNGSYNISSSLKENLRELNTIFDRCSDAIIRELTIGTYDELDACLVYMDGMSNESLVSEHIMEAVQDQVPYRNKEGIINFLKQRLISVVEITTSTNMEDLIEHVLSGDVALLVDGASEAIIVNAREWITRSVEKPETESVVRGPREGFTETLRTNTTMVRRRVKTSRLKMETLKIGTLSKTDVAVAYIEGIANPKIVEEVRRRLERIEIDGVLESGYLEEFIEDDPYSVFSQAKVTERPDSAAGDLLEGYIAIFVDNTPMVIVVPITFSKLLQTSEDYYHRSIYATFIRLLRYVTLNIALLLPALYIAVLNYHQEMLPTSLLISVAGQREGIPFPAFVEALFILIIFEILREAGIRLPKPIGQAVSIFGALVIGQAAISAELISPIMVMVIALTAISSFTIPDMGASYAVRVLRLPLMIAAAVLGLFGIIAVLMAILFHLCALRSFGVPYVSPMAPVIFREWKDTFVRVPWWLMRNRPDFVSRNARRQQTAQKPGPNKRGDKTLRGRRGRGDEGNA